MVHEYLSEGKTLNDVILLISLCRVQVSPVPSALPVPRVPPVHRDNRDSRDDKETEVILGHRDNRESEALPELLDLLDLMVNQDNQARRDRLEAPDKQDSVVKLEDKDSLEDKVHLFTNIISSEFLYEEN